MATSTLKFQDGFDGKAANLRDDVKKLQQALKKAGFSVGTDGLFGKGTLEAVKSFQRDQGLKDDGIVGVQTWKLLNSSKKPKVQKRSMSSKSSLLKGFHGDLDWIHEREGHAGKAYWPGGASGVTLDPGIDLGYADPPLIEEAYKKLLTSAQLAAIKDVLGIKEDKAKKALHNNAVLQTIKISRPQAESIFKYVVQPYWNTIVKRFPNLANTDTLPAVQTAMLSLAYNRGANNKAFEDLKQSIAKKKWSKLADQIGSMQQDHTLKMIRERRRLEADLIRSVEY